MCGQEFGVEQCVMRILWDDPILISFTIDYRICKIIFLYLYLQQLQLDGGLSYYAEQVVYTTRSKKLIL